MGVPRGLVRAVGGPRARGVGLLQASRKALRPAPEAARMAALLKRAAAKRVSEKRLSEAPALLAAAVAGAAAAVITHKLLATERCPG